MGSRGHWLGREGSTWIHYLRGPTIFRVTPLLTGPVYLARAGLKRSPSPGTDKAKAVPDFFDVAIPLSVYNVVPLSGPFQSNSRKLSHTNQIIRLKCQRKKS